MGAAAMNVGQMTDRQLASESARLTEEYGRLAQRQRDIAIELRESGNSDQVRAKWNAADKESRNVHQKLEEVKNEIERRERETPEYKQQVRYENGQRRMLRRAEERLAQTTSLTWEREKRRREKRAENFMKGR